MSIESLQSFLREHRIDTIEAGFGDFQGQLRGKRFPVGQFERIVESGFTLCKAALAWDVKCDIFPIDLVSFEEGYPDVIARPIPETLRAIPWREGSAFVLCDLEYPRGEPLPVTPREVLKNIVAQANALGLRPVIGAELEFYLLDAERKPLYEGIQCYSLYRGTEVEYILKEIRNSLEAFGIAVEASNTEYGPAQIEINLVYDDALAIADKTLLFKNAVKEIARKHGLYATFMAKPWAGESGNGFHVHQSLWDLDRKTNLFDKDQTLVWQSLAGLQATAREFAVLGAPTVNSYKRIRDHSFAPTNVTWGHDNRTVATRSLLELGSANRLEHRTGAADANPYLIIAANIAGVLHGIANRLQPSSANNGDAYLSDAPTLPTTLHEALDLLEAGEAARKWFSEEFLNHFVSIGRHEIANFDRAVTDWERERYLELA
jgi:glutamine synthetase